MTPAVTDPTESRTDSTDPLTDTTVFVPSGWYDPDASAWEPQPPTLFEALRASPPRATLVVDSERARDRAASR
jgi:hypothetical protein